MIRKILKFAVCLACAAFVPARPATSSNKPAKRDAAAPVVDEVLRREMVEPVDRRTRLADTLSQKPELEAARWQSGFVRSNKAWRSFDAQELPPADSEKLQQYREQRSAAPATGAGQLALAEWCRTQGLADQDRAHLHRAIGLSPELATQPLLYRLGYRQVGGQWLSREQCEEWSKLGRQAEKSIEKWEPRLARATQKFSEGQSNRTTILKQLKQVVDSSAVPAIEYLLAGQSEESAELAVGILKEIDGYEASQALAKQAAFSNWPQVRKSAAVALKNRKFEDFVPPLINLLSAPVTAEFRVFDPGVQRGVNAAPGALYYSLILARETVDQFQVATLQTVNLMADDYLAPGSRIVTEIIDERRNPGNRLPAINNGPALRALARGRVEAVRAMQERLYLQQRTVEDLNDRTTELNGQIGSVLATVSGQAPTSDPRPWWDWWAQFTDTQQTGDKTVVTVSETDVVGNRTPTYLTYGPVRYLSCFAAGTPVWTETGLTPIEKIAVGDRVLSKDCETGELTYKPVLQTTVRPPKELYVLRLAKEKIVCTGGHRFWVSGAGWVKARDLTSHMLLHTVVGSTAVEAEKTTRSEETYNLVVPEFHTYLVGQTGVLAQDLLLPKPTNRHVPGLSTDVAAAKGR